MKITLATLFLSFASLSFSQLELNTSSKRIIPINTPNNIERYGHDYILTDYEFQNGDSTILNKIDLEFLEQYRLQHENVEVIESNILMSITLFAKEAIIQAPIINAITEE